jgi:hypothetical protein
MKVLLMYLIVNKEISARNDFRRKIDADRLKQPFGGEKKEDY